MIARFAGRHPDRSLMLECHSDTVSAENMSIDPFTPIIRDGRLYGRGASDTKGAMAAMLAGLAEVIKNDGKPPVTVYLVTTCNEEQGATGAHALMESGFRTDAAIVGEPTDLRIVDTHKGAIRYRLDVIGRAAHSSDPRQGINAISKAAAIIRRIDGPLTDELAQSRHPRLGCPVISVGVIDGGSLVNIIPDRCRFEIDRRLLPGETGPSATAQLTRHLDAVGAEDPPLSYRLHQTQYYPPLAADPRSAFGVMLDRVVARFTGASGFEAAPWGSDAGPFHDAGIPVFVFGPGSIRQAHSADEFIALDAVKKAAGIYAEFIRQFH